MFECKRERVPCVANPVCTSVPRAGSFLPSGPHMFPQSLKVKSYCYWRFLLLPRGGQGCRCLKIRTQFFRCVACFLHCLNLGIQLQSLVLTADCKQSSLDLSPGENPRPVLCVHTFLPSQAGGSFSVRHLCVPWILRSVVVISCLLFEPCSCLL